MRHMFSIMTISACLLVSSCGMFENASNNLGNQSDQQTIEILTTRNGDVSEGQFLASATDAQEMTGSGALSDVSLVIPAGTLQVNTTIQISSGLTLNEADEVADLGLGDSNGITAQGSSVSFIPADRSVLPSQALTLQIPMAVAVAMGLLQEDGTGFQAVLYQAIIPGQEGSQFGVIPTADLRMEGGNVVFESLYFGTFQAIVTEEPVAERASVDSETALPPTAFVTEAGKTQQEDAGEAPPEPEPEPEPDPTVMTLIHEPRHNDGAVSPELTFTAQTDATTYRVAIEAGAELSADPTWHSISGPGTHTIPELTLADGTHYYAHAQALDANGQVLEQVSTAGWQQLVCPDGYIKVPGNETAGLGGSVYTHGSKTNYDWSAGTATTRDISDFCVMKYEATSDGSGATISSATGERTTQVTVNDAKNKCAAIGTNYGLLANNHWQTIARDIEQVSSNTSNDGVFNIGHYQNWNSQVLTPNSDNLPCAGIPAQIYVTVSNDCDNSWQRYKRTHILSNGEVIWDLTGNASELIADRPTSIIPITSDNDHDNGSSWNWIHMVKYLDSISLEDQLTYGPSHLDYSASVGAPYWGLGTINIYSGASVSSSNPAVLERGSSHWFDENQWSGLFALRVNGNNPEGRNNYDVGFRCVYAP